MGEIRKENLHQSLIEYLDGLGLTEEQVQGLIDNSLLNCQQFKLTQDNGYNKIITTGSFNDIVTPGIYTIFSEVTDGPFSGYTGWYHLEVIADSNLWVKQTATIFEATGYGTKMYIRGMQNGTWAPWREFVDSVQLNNVQKYKLTTNDGQGFGLTNQDANSCTGAGTIYIGENITNSPNCQVGIWWTIENYLTMDGQWGHQIATAWHSDEVYIRRKTSNGWLPWRSL